MKYVKNRAFALFFAIIIFLWIIWSSIWTEVQFGPVNAPGWPYLDPFHITLFIVVVGLLYEVYRPSLDFKFNKNKKWTAAGIFLLAIAVIVVISIAFLEIDEPGQNIFGDRTFEYPIGSGQIHVWPNLLFEFLTVFCMETVSLSLLFGILFMTKSTPQESKSYKIMLIGAVAVELFFFLLFYLPFFITGVGQANLSGLTRMELLTSYWFHWDLWSEFVILIGAIWLLRKGKLALNSNKTT
ncbi:MAG: hypothetical protein AABX25_02890 [Nanoarchaeota archaeon]